MRVAILHVSRMKLTNENHQLLTAESKGIIEKYIEDHLSSKVENTSIHNYFINSGNCWSQMKEIIEEINQKKFDGFFLFMTGSASDLHYFNKDFLDSTHTHLKKTPICNLIYTKGYLSFFLRNIDPLRFGTKMGSKVALDA